MPIFITSKEFLKKTDSWMHSRPFELRRIDTFLANYYCLVKHNPYSSQAYEALLFIQINIENWAEDKKTHIVKGKKRYKHSRDRYGMISELEVQVERTLVELHQARNQIEQHIKANLGKHTIMHLPMPPSVPTRVPLTFGPSISPPFPPRRVKKGARDSTESFDDDWFKSPSLRTFELMENRSQLSRQLSIVSEQEDWQPTAVPSSRLIEHDAYEAAAQMINLTRPKHILSGQEVQRSIFKVSSELHLIDISKGLQQLGLDVFYEKHCSVSHFQCVLSNARMFNPVLVCVNDGSLSNRLIICFGLHYEGEGTNQLCSYLVQDPRAPFKESTMALNGDYFVNLGHRQEHYTLVPSLGYIKLRR